MEQHVQFIATPDGVRIAYAVIGQGPPFVWVPGWVSHLEIEWQSRVRRPSLELMAQRVTLIRHDKRGTGLSAWRVGDYTLESALRDLEALIDYLGPDTFAVGGLSEGAAVAMLYAARHPERVTKLVLCGAYADGSGIMAPPEMRDAVRAVVKTQWGVASKLLSAIFLGDDSNVTPERFGEFQLAAAAAEDALAILDRAINIDIRDELPRITAPTLVYHHRDDMVVPLQLGQDVAAQIKGARFLSRRGAHHPSAQGWIDFTEAAVAFLHDETITVPSRETNTPVRSAPATPIDSGSSRAVAPVYDDGSLVIDAGQHVVMRNGARIDCSPTEFRLLVALATDAGRLHSYAELLHRVWGAEYVGETDFLHVYVSRLRKKLGADAIRTERGFGYRLGG